MCEIMDVFTKWALTEQQPRLKAMAAHIKQCESCKAEMKNIKDVLGLALITTPAENLYEVMVKLAEDRAE